MNKDKLTYLCHKISEDNNISFNDVMPYYFMESVLKKISNSRYHDNFVYKGGYLLSCILGIDSRTTKDIDLLIECFKLESDVIYKLFQEILNPLPSDEIDYQIVGVDSIKENDIYGGFRVSIMCKTYNIKQKVSIDIATGDVITPFPIDYRYKSIFDNNEIKIKTYNLETILAEKVQTIYEKGLINSRKKDFYDLYIIYKLKLDEIDVEVFKEACISTFAYRNTKLDFNEIIVLLKNIKTNNQFNSRWQSYALKNTYTSDLTFDEVIDCAIKLIMIIIDN